MAAGIVYIGWSVALKHFRFDDAVDTVAGNTKTYNYKWKRHFSKVFVVFIFLFNSYWCSIHVSH